MKDDINYYQKYKDLERELEEFKKVMFTRSKASKKKIKELEEIIAKKGR